MLNISNINAFGICVLLPILLGCILIYCTKDLRAFCKYILEDTFLFTWTRNDLLALVTGIILSSFYLFTPDQITCHPANNYVNMADFHPDFTNHPLYNPMYLDQNRTHPFAVTVYYLYKELLTIMDDGQIFYRHRIDYDVDYFFLNETYNTFMENYNKNQYCLSVSEFLLNNINSSSWTLAEKLLNTDELLLDLNVATLYWSAEPTFKFYIPYPFVASGNFHYHDYWWLHIAVYYYWLWFFFIFLIIFFLVIVMWEIDYNLTKNNPQRETRGVSRSKCGDLITAVVPVSWASAIIIHESTDSIDHFDGFGTLDFVVGIRAFQWGWEYYYPNNLKINYSNSNEKNLLLGNDNLINNVSDEFIFSQNMKHLILNKNKNTNILPLYLITNPDLNKLYFNINKMGNFGFSKLCIYTAYKFTLKNKAINYNNILNSTINLTNFNAKKFIDNYKTDISNTSSNFKQFKLPNARSIKLFKKTYNANDLNLFNTNSISYNDHNYNLTTLNNSLSINSNFRTYTNSICKLIQLNQKKLTINLDNFINFDVLTYLKINNIAIESNVKSTNLDSSKNSNTLNLPNLINSTNVFDNLKLNAEKFAFFEKLNSITLTLELKQNTNTLINNFNFILNNYFADIDFKRLQQNELLEDLYWDFYFIDGTNDDSLANLWNKNEFNYKTRGFYKLDNNLFWKNYLLTLNWYKLYTNLYNISQNSIIRIDSEYKFINLTNKINYFFELSFVNFKNFTTTIISSNLNNILNYNNYTNIINSSYFINNFIKFNPYTVSYSNLSLLNESNNLKFSLNSNLTENLKNYNIMNNSFWKVFKYSYYDERSFLNPLNFSFLNFKLPIVDTTNFALSKIINKNQINFMNTLNLNKKLFIYNNIYLNKQNNLINLISFDLPFDVSSECDMFKYSWIDWYNFYIKKETKFQDLKEYNLNGSKLFFNKYDYFFNDANDLMVIENYFNKLLNNRKNYTNLYNFIPYLLFKNNLNTSLIDIKSIFNRLDILNSISVDTLDQIFLKYCLAFDKTVELNFLNLSFLNNINSFFTYNKNFLNTLNSWNNYNNYVLMLNNVLTKRTFLLKQLFFTNLNYNNFNMYNSNLINVIMNDWKTVLLTDQTPLYDKTNLLLKLIKLDNVMVLDNYDFSNLFNNNKKNQYNHMRKSVNNMLRLQNDKAVCMPTDTRIQILTWSKDIIHSWAIPSAGIKIDCIPGYSSHKVFNLLLTGIYYGQCMEICGRFHHWMPIVVYFVRRDLFLFWCTNFLNSKKNEYIGINKKIKNTTNKVNL